MDKKRIKILNYRTDQGIAPKPENIVHGEIAIGYKKGSEAIYIKNSDNEIVDFTSSIISLTYSELRDLRRRSKLKPSQYYRITDFVTTVANDPEAQSAGHPFDIIILATDKRKLQEECYAIRHERDKYFKNCNLAAWKIWYCLENDNKKYAWADTTNGTGVIYRMIDEWGNDCPYDFKNVQFKRYRVTHNSTNVELSGLDGTYIGYKGEMNGLSIPNTEDFVWAYTFSFGNRQDSMTPKDASIIGYNNPGYSSNGYYGDNSIKPLSKIMTVDNSTFSVFCLNNIVWWTNNDKFHRSLINGNRIESECFNMTLSGNGTIIEYDCQNFIMGDGCFGNVFGRGGALNTFGNKCSSNTFGNGCNTNTFGASCTNNQFGDGCNSNTFGSECTDNHFENRCYYNTFGNNCTNNQFGNDCNTNTFGNGCNTNTFENNCSSNTFGNNCTNNQFGNSCGSNQFKDICTYNHFGNGCNTNTFENNCNSNTFGNACSSNQFKGTCSSNYFGNVCLRNTFGGDCSSNTFGNKCSSNQFGNGCNGNTFGNDCNTNTFENNCNSNTFGNGCTDSTFGNYFQYNALGNHVQYVEITTENIYNTQILNGTKGTSSSDKLTIAFTSKTPYSQFAGLTNKLGLDGKNTLRTWIGANVEIQSSLGS